VIAAATRSGISGAVISIVGNSITGVTASDGSYSITYYVYVQQFSVQASVSGYNTLTLANMGTSNGAINFELESQQPDGTIVFTFTQPSLSAVSIEYSSPDDSCDSTEGGSGCEACGLYISYQTDAYDSFTNYITLTNAGLCASDGNSWEIYLQAYETVPYEGASVTAYTNSNGESDTVTFSFENNYQTQFNCFLVSSSGVVSEWSN